MAHGKTLQLRAITRPDPEYLVRYEVEEQKVRIGVRKVARLVKVGTWTPYVNPERDKKRHARLRAELRRTGQASAS